MPIGARCLVWVLVLVRPVLLTIWEIGNPATDSSKVLDISQYHVFLLERFPLVAGTLREYRITTSPLISPIRLQIWRPLSETIFKLHYEKKVFSQKADNWTFYPGDQIIIENGDKIGFMSEVDTSGIVYDFLPRADAAIARVHQVEGRIPQPGESFAFNEVYDAWAFSLSVKVDDEYGQGPLSPEPTLPPLPPTPSETKAPPTPPPTTSTPPGVYTIGNPIVNGNIIWNITGSYILDDFRLPNGFVTSFHLYVAQANQELWLQLWRPHGANSYRLIAQTNFTATQPGNQTHSDRQIYLVGCGGRISLTLLALEMLPPEPTSEPEHCTHMASVGNGFFSYVFVFLIDPIEIEEGDKIGLTSLTGPLPIAVTLAQTGNGSNISHLSTFTDNTLPEIGVIYNFSDSSHNLIFSIAVDVDTDTDKYTPPPASYGPIHIVQGGISPVNQLMMFLLIFTYIMIAIISTLYALWVIIKRYRKVDLASYEKRIILTPELEWTIPRANIYLYETLSETVATTVMKAEVFGIGAKPGWTTAAICMLRATASDQEKQAFIREMEVMRMLKSHANVLQLLGCCVEKDRGSRKYIGQHPDISLENPMMMITEPVPFGNLTGYLRELRDTHIHMNIAGHSNFTLTMDLLGFAAQVARGMSYLSSFRVLHRDLAARNVLLGEGKLCKISHFGAAQDVVENRQYERAIKNPLPIRWMAPESLNSNIYTSKSDVWAFGILLWEIVTLGATPYHEDEPSKVVKNVKKGIRLDKPPHCKEDLYNIMISTWRTKAHDRPSFDNLTKIVQELHDQNTDLVQLEKYQEEHYTYLPSKGVTDEII